jgi:hypothetical protein
LESNVCYAWIARESGLTTSIIRHWPQYARRQNGKWQANALEMCMYEVWVLAGFNGLETVFGPLFRTMIKWAGRMLDMGLDLMVRREDGRRLYSY